MGSASAHRCASTHLDISTRQVILGHNELLQIDILRQGHAASVDAENAPLGLLIRERELNLTVNASCGKGGR